ncbi:MAG: dodecin family protein [Candidatus Tectomicrobia bacterium]|nr:dodecin family protein [Candidatus Tectomicrobia bacterium]
MESAQPGSSTTANDDTIRAAVAKAGKTVRGMRWLEVVQIRGYIEDGEVAH